MKKIVKYEQALFTNDDMSPVGHRVVLELAEPHPASYGRSKEARDALTSPVISYDETTGHIETLNTVYVPSTSEVEDT